MTPVPSGSRARAAALVATAAVAFAATTIPADHPLVEWAGRPYNGTLPHSVAFQWYARARIAHNGTTLRALVGPATAPYKLSFAQSVEGYSPWQGASWVTLSDSTGPGIVVASGGGEARVALNTPPQYFAGAGQHEAAIVGFETDGSFLPLSPSKNGRRTLHFIGDSITAATNIHGIAPFGGSGTASCADGGYQADWAASYGGLLCAAFDANCSIVAVGGKGLVRNCCDNGLKMPDYYVRTRMTDPAPSWAFGGPADPAPDAVVVYLGTNDYNNGANPSLDALFADAFAAFSYNITRRWYGTPSAPANTTVFAVLGPMAPTLPTNGVLTGLVQAQALGVRALLLNATLACGGNFSQGCTDGCAHHPGVAGHRAIAQLIAPTISNVLGWQL